ncbi:MAG: hypothetical protein RI958_2599 [Actinomycetota bacterium]|jgi:hypothetical protein
MDVDGIVALSVRRGQQFYDDRVLLLDHAAQRTALASLR